MNFSIASVLGVLMLALSPAAGEEAGDVTEKAERE